jgi:hypothetical protein
VHIDTARPLEVVDVLLRPTGFAPGTPVAAGAALGADDGVDLPVPYGAADCATGGAHAVDADALLTVRTRDGRTRRVRLPLARAAELLGRLHTTECAEQAVRAQVDVALGPWREQGDALAGTLVLQRRSGRARITVPELGQNTIYDLDAGPPDGPVVVLEPTAERAVVPVRAVAQRCEAHALIESKRTAVVRVFVQVDERAPLLLLVAADPAGARTMVGFATTSCRRRV